ncbi:MAG: type II toxin-antitoxin system PemK/MazF family toxin [Propionibacteriales bacterium]|nr:type II toxin-antitoxin system PemK/MazF family toxin [Propionibacteriales bacterium]
MPEYNPAVDGRPFPGEVVWTWVAFEPGSRNGKDRPVLVLQVDGAQLTALPMRSKNEDRNTRHDRRAVWMDLGVGDWDRHGRGSEIQLNRFLKVSIYDVRRNGAELDPELFDDVLVAARRYR